MRKIVRNKKTGRAEGTERVWSNDHLIFAIQIESISLNCTPTFEDMKRRHRILGGPHPKTIQERFGSWSKACKAAGLPPNRLYDDRFLVSEVERFIKEYGHIPSTNEFRYTEGYPGIKAYKRLFGSFNQCLVAIGYTPIAVTKKNTFCQNVVAKDGHVCDSHEEGLVDNWMTDHGIQHSIQPLYPRHEVLNPNGFIRADFLIEGIFIEYAGLIDKPYYRERLTKKTSLAREIGIELIIIEPTDLSHLETKLGRFEKKRNTLRSGMAPDMV